MSKVHLLPKNYPNYLNHYNDLSNKQPKGSYAAASHSHDDRYYTEGEVNNLLNGKQNAGSYAAAYHTHDDRYYTEAEVNNIVNNKFYCPVNTIFRDITVNGNGNAAVTFDNITDNVSGFSLVSTTVEINKDLIHIGYHYENSRLRVSFYNSYGSPQTIGIITIRQVFQRV